MRVCDSQAQIYHTDAAVRDMCNGEFLPSGSLVMMVAIGTAGQSNAGMIGRCRSIIHPEPGSHHALACLSLAVFIGFSRVDAPTCTRRRHHDPKSLPRARIARLAY